MTKKQRRKLFITAMAYLFMWTNCHAAASGHYTDMLPNPTSASGFTQGTLVFNGYDWSVATLAPTTTYGDSLSRTETTLYQSTGVAVIQNTAAVSTFTAAAVNAGNVGSTTFPASWVAAGRSIRVTARGTYTTTGTPTWNFGIALGTMTVLATGALNAPTTVSTVPFSASALLTINSTGASGTVSAAYDIWVTTAASGGAVGGNLVSYSTATAAATSIDLTSQLTVNPIFTWGTGSSGNVIKATNVTVEFLN